MKELLEKLIAALEEKGKFAEAAGLKALLANGDVVAEVLGSMPPEFMEGVNSLSLPVKVNGDLATVSFNFPDLNGEEPGLGWGGLGPAIALGVVLALIARAR